METENLLWRLNKRKKNACETFIYYSCDLQISGCRVLWIFQFSLMWRNSRTNYWRWAAWALGFCTSLLNMESCVSSLTGKYRHFIHCDLHCPRAEGAADKAVLYVMGGIQMRWVCFPGCCLTQWWQHQVNWRRQNVERAVACSAVSKWHRYSLFITDRAEKPSTLNS